MSKKHERKLYITSPGSFRNPLDKPCWKSCESCARCEKKGTQAQCIGCSGRYDPDGQRIPHPDDTCRCKEGIMQWVTEKGEFIQFRYPKDPFKGTVKHETKSESERDWESYLSETRERLDDESFDPIQFDDGSSTEAWLNKQRLGK